MSDFEYELIGCSDHNCIITTPKRKGMGTNGGCGCAKDLQRIGAVGLNATRKIRLQEQRIALLEAALVRIRNIDYRGNRHESSVIAFDVLQEKDNE